MNDFLIILEPLIVPIILILAGFELGVFIYLIIDANIVLKKITSKSANAFKKDKSRSLNMGYNIFSCIISLFPLLGMLGTVLALLNLDITSENTDALKNSFFNALNTTAWGLIFSIGFKLLHSIIEARIENAINRINIFLQKRDEE